MWNGRYVEVVNSATHTIYKSTSKNEIAVTLIWYNGIVNKNIQLRPYQISLIIFSRGGGGGGGGLALWGLNVNKSVSKNVQSLWYVSNLE